MSQSDFAKAVCQQCGGHLEFPANAAGQIISCPHCGQSTELVIPDLPSKPRGFNRIWLGLGLGVCLVAAALAGVFFYRQQASQDTGNAATPLPIIVSNTPVAPPKPSQILTNGFAILPFTLEKTTNSTLVYVTGIIRNMNGTQRFGVKVEFDLFDTNDTPLGSAKDYQSVMEPHGEWRFKALVIQSKAASVQFDSIAEEK